jgi:hypothetical protein
MTNSLSASIADGGIQSETSDRGSTWVIRGFVGVRCRMRPAASGHWLDMGRKRGSVGCFLNYQVFAHSEGWFSRTMTSLGPR